MRVEVVLRTLLSLSLSRAVNALPSPTPLYDSGVSMNVTKPINQGFEELLDSGYDHIRKTTSKLVEPFEMNGNFRTTSSGGIEWEQFLVIAQHYVTKQLFTTMWYPGEEWTEVKIKEPSLIEDDHRSWKLETRKIDFKGALQRSSAAGFPFDSGAVSLSQYKPRYSPWKQPEYWFLSGWREAHIGAGNGNFHKGPWLASSPQVTNTSVYDGAPTQTVVVETQ